MGKKLFGSIRQIGIVVEDVAKAVEVMTHAFGAGPWDGYLFGPSMVSGMKYRGARQDYEAGVAVTRIGSIEIELVEPRDARSIYAEHLHAHGPGLHHVCYDVDDFDEVDAQLRTLGHERAHEGTVAGGTFFAYYDCLSTMGCFLELRKSAPDPGCLAARFPCPAPAPGKALFSETRHIAFVVEDVRERAVLHQDLFGVGPWKEEAFDSDSLSDLRYYGRPADYAVEVAVCSSGDADIELVSASGAPNIYADHLSAHGSGLHHVCFDVADYGLAVKAMENAGFACAQEGTIGGEVDFAYFDCRDVLGCFIELYTTREEGCRHG